MRGATVHPGMYAPLFPGQHRGAVGSHHVLAVPNHIKSSLSRTLKYKALAGLNPLGYPPFDFPFDFPRMSPIFYSSRAALNNHLSTTNPPFHTDLHFSFHLFNITLLFGFFGLIIVLLTALLSPMVRRNSAWINFYLTGKNVFCQFTLD
jgi:hypothetical protein